MLTGFATPQEPYDPWSDVPSVVPPTAGPDSELIGACQNLCEMERMRRDLWRGASTPAAEDAVEALTEQMAGAYGRAMHQVCTLRAATVAGLTAKAAAIVAVEPDFLCGVLEGSAAGGRLVASLLRDLMALGGG